jgi:hypothetical protein
VVRPGSNQAPFEYKPEALSLEPTWSVSYKTELIKIEVTALGNVFEPERKKVAGDVA